MAARAHRRQRGVALLLVLWAFMILGVLAFDFGRMMRDDAMASINFAEETQAYFAALGVLNREVFRMEMARESGLAPDPEAPELDPEAEPNLMTADGVWHDTEFGGARAKWRATDECARLPINHVDEAALTRVIRTLVLGTNATEGVDRREQAEVDGIVGAILDWRDRDHTKHVNGAESEYYRSARGYPAKNALFDSPEELLLVKGVTADLYYGRDGMPGLRDVVSVYCRQSVMNGKGMTAPVLTALGLDPADVEELMQVRDEDQVAYSVLLEAKLNNKDPALTELVQSEEVPQHVMVEVQAEGAGPVNRSSIEAVLDFEDSALGEKPLARLWRDRAPWQGSLPRGTAGTEAAGGSPAPAPAGEPPA